MSNTLYRTDYHAWAKRQAELLREGRFADANHIAWPGKIEQLCQAWPVEGFARDDILEDADCLCLVAQTSALHFQILVWGGDAGVTEDIGHGGIFPVDQRSGCPLIERFGRN